MRGRDRASRVLVLPNQVPELISQYGLSRAEVDWAVWAISPDGQRSSAAAAVNRTLQELGFPWTWIAASYRFAPLRWVEDRGYRWVANHRPWFSSWLGAPPEWKE